MRIKGLILALLAIILSNAMVSAKLTIVCIPYINSLSKDQTPNGVSKSCFDERSLTLAKIRQAMLYLYGDEWLKDHIKRILDNPTGGRLEFFVGNGNQLILAGGPIWDKKMLLKTKKAFDYLSEKNDTLYFSTYENFMNEPVPDYTYPLASAWAIINMRGRTFKPHRLYVGSLQEKGIAYKHYMLNLFSYSATNEYKQACEEKGYTYISFGSKINDFDKNVVTQRDIDHLVDFIIKEDRKVLEAYYPHLHDKKTISRCRYEYDKDAKMYYGRMKE